jgi:hypothetical protein
VPAASGTCRTASRPRPSRPVHRNERRDRHHQQSSFVAILTLAGDSMLNAAIAREHWIDMAEIKIEAVAGHRDRSSDEVKNFMI